MNRLAERLLRVRHFARGWSRSAAPRRRQSSLSGRKMHGAFAEVNEILFFPAHKFAVAHDREGSQHQQNQGRYWNRQ